MLKDMRIVIPGACVISFAAGAVISYFITKKKVDREWEGEFQLQYHDMKEYYEKKYKVGRFSDPVKLVEAQNIIEKEDYSSSKYDNFPDNLIVPEEDETEEEVEEVSRPDDNFDYDVEIPNRNPDTPYVIHYDEFSAQERDYIQNTLTYYEGDDRLTDEHDKLIDDVEMVVGEANLLRFGHGSHDNNVVYIRNERLDLDFEVVRSHKTYTEEILGFSLEHQDRPGARRDRKFRRDDG